MTWPDVAESPAPTVAIDAAAKVFSRWLGVEYDLGALDVILAVAATEQLGGDPPWLLVVSGSGNAKTETVVSLAGIGAHIVSTITSEGALLSATPGKERAQNATGGLLRKVGPRGLVVIKDFTSILSMNRDMRASVLAALREVYDGRWDRNVGTDGGRTLSWSGRIVVVGAVTTAWDSHHTVIAAMGDRFCLVRMDSGTGRRAAGRQALANVDHEIVMRAELVGAVGALLVSVDATLALLGTDEQEMLLDLADLVTMARTAVERDYRGDVIDAHAPEMPTRFAKMLGQIVRGGLALGMSETRALTAAVRVAGDSMPPIRLAVLADLAGNPLSRTTDVARRLQRPRSTVDRELQALHILGLLVIDDQPGGWRYDLADTVDRSALAMLITRNVSTEHRPSSVPQFSSTDISGDGE